VSSLAPTYAEARADLLARPGIPGPGRRQALAEAADAWLVEVFEAAGGPGAGASLVAVGGYGRSELSPGSDLDLLLIVRSSASAEAGLAERIWYPLWDSGVRVDHAVRTAGEARLVAAEDLRALLGLLDARCVAGDPEPVQRVVSSVLADWRAAARRRLPDLLADCRQRHERAGHLAYALEPDLKEGRGGLRDLAVLRAIGASWVADAPHAGLSESRRLLLDVRDALHMSGGRGSDRLVQQEHAHVAEAMGLADGDALLAAIGEAARTITYAFDTVAARVERAVSGGSRRTFLAGPLRRGPKRLPVRAPLADGVVEQDGEVVLARDARPALDASLGLRAAAAAAQAGLRLAPHTVERLAAEGADLPIPWPRDAREALVSLLGAGAATVPVWEALDLSGLVSRWIPEWSAVRYRQQHNPIHRFTVDRHLVEAAAHASTLTRRVARPDLLLVGALLHDIGKGFPGDHTQAGMVVVADLAPRIGFDAADTATLVAMIRLHLLLPETATRRDLDDPATLSAVAAEVGTRELLDLLHALAQADALATGPAAWTEWRAALIDDLAERTRQTLAGDPAPPPPALDGADLPGPGPDGLAVAWTATSYGHRLLVSAPDRVGLLADVAGVLSLQRLAVRSARVASVGGRAVQEWVVTPEFGDPPAVDRVRVDLRRTLDGTLDLGGRLAARAADYAPGRGVVIAPPRVELVPGASSAATVMEVRAHDRPGLLRTVAAALAAEAVDVSAAVVATLGSDAVDVFYLAQDGGPLDAATAERARVAVLGSLA